MTERTAEKVKNSECVIFSGGHFPTSEDPVKFDFSLTRLGIHPRLTYADLWAP